MSNPYSGALGKIKTARSTTNTYHKGRLFEESASEIFTSVPNIVVWDSNVVTSDGSQEIDIIFIQEMPTKLWFMGHSFFVECKCTASSVPSKEITVFGEKLTTAGIDYGIVFSLNGISGSEREAGHAVILRYKERGKHILSVTKSEIAKLSGYDDLINLMISKKMALYAGRII